MLKNGSTLFSTPEFTSTTSSILTNKPLQYYKDKMGILKSLTMLNEDTIELVFHDNIKIDLDGMREGWIELDNFTQNKPLKKLTIVGRNTDITHEARKFGHTEIKARGKYIKAEAMVVHTLPQKMIANFYFAFVKNMYPVKYFTDVDEAKEWLKAI